MSKIKVGDRVKILPRKPGDRNKRPCYVDSMTDLEGNIFVVRDISDATGYIRYGRFSWHPDWLRKTESDSFVELWK